MQISPSVVAFQSEFCLLFPSNVQLLIPNTVCDCLRHRSSSASGISGVAVHFPDPSWVFFFASSYLANPSFPWLAQDVPVLIDSLFRLQYIAT